MKNIANCPRVDFSGMKQDDFMLDVGAALEQISGLVNVAIEDYESIDAPENYKLEAMYYKTQPLLFAIRKYAFEANQLMDAWNML